MSKPKKPPAKPKRGPFDLTAEETQEIQDYANLTWRITPKKTAAPGWYVAHTAAAYLKARAGRKA